MNIKNYSEGLAFPVYVFNANEKYLRTNDFAKTFLSALFPIKMNSYSTKLININVIISNLLNNERLSLPLRKEEQFGVARRNLIKTKLHLSLT